MKTNRPAQPLDQVAKTLAPWVSKHGLYAPYGMCQCGCGSVAEIAYRNHRKTGWAKGEPTRFASGHRRYERRSRREAFYQFVVPSGCDECWPWQGVIKENGYGYINAWNDEEQRFKVAYAHRISYEIHHGPIPPGMHVCHSCDNRACCNPSHLWVGSRLDNMQDAAAKKRIAVGERCGTAKLTDDQVAEIRRLSSLGTKQAEIASMFGTSQPNVSRIVNEKGWTHLLDR